MTKHPKTDDTLVELWAIKDETAARHGSVSAYAQHLNALQSPRATAGKIDRTNQIKSRADLSAFKRILKRKGGEPPRAGDERR